MIAGARCSDGIVLVADRKFTDYSGNENPQFGQKIFGDVEHILIGYTGWERTFDIFRKYMVGDLVINRHDIDYLHTYDNYIPISSDSVRRFNSLVINDRRQLFKVLIAKHIGTNSELHYIDTNGTACPVIYKAIGSGENYADRYCSGLEYDKITMKDFAKRAYFSILFMDQHHPKLGVGIEPDGNPNIRYLNFNELKDIEAPPIDKTECREYAISKLKEWNEKESNFLKD
jgi:20S proteasome alpha/beta subunit